MPFVKIYFFLVIAVLVTTPGWSQEKPKKPYMLHEEAESAFNEGRYQEALDLLNECLKVNPGYMEAYALRASVRDQLKDDEGALTDYSIYLEKFPDHREVLLNRAVLRYRIGFYQQAREDFLSILLLPPSGETNSLLFRKQMSVSDKNPVINMAATESHNAILYNYLGLTEAKLKNYPQAKHYLDTAIHLNEFEADYFVNRGLVRENLNDSTAFLDYERALRLNPNHTLAKHNLNAFESKRKKSMTAEQRLSQTIAADSTMLYPYLERAQQRYGAEYYEGAAEDYTNALEIDSTNEEIWLGRGLAREKMRDYEGAFSDYTQAIEMKNDFAKAWLNRGNVLLKQDRYEDAIEDYNVALIYYADYAVAYYNRAMAKMKLKKNEEACSDLKQAEILGMKVEEKVKSRVCR